MLKGGVTFFSFIRKRSQICTGKSFSGNFAGRQLPAMTRKTQQGTIIPAKASCSLTNSPAACKFFPRTKDETIRKILLNPTDKYGQ
jgi:hypothetical protein